MIDFNKFISYFDNEQSLILVRAFSAAWFVGDSCFNNDSWIVESVLGSIKIDFDVAIAPGELLTDNDDLCRAVKISAYLVRSIHNNNQLGGVLSGESQYKHVNQIINHIRWLKLNEISNLSSVNQAVISKFHETVGEPLHVRLNIISRLNDALDRLKTSSDLEPYTVLRASNVKPEFSVSKLAKDIGVSDRVLSNTHSLLSVLVKFRSEKGFYVKPELNRYLSAENTVQADALSIDSIRKELTSIAKFYRQLQVFKDLFPFSQQMSSDFFQNANFSIRNISNKNGRPAERTKDIPQPIFFELMDRAIRWVIDYEKPLFELKEEALMQYDRLRVQKARGGTQENKDHYASKQIGDWLGMQLKNLSGQPGAPYPVRGFRKKIVARSKNLVLSYSQIQEARLLHNGGMKLENIGKRYGVSRSTVHRLISQEEKNSEGESLNKYLHHFLPTACLLVIYCFTARRQCEVEGLEAGCCRDTPNGPVIEMYSAKVLQQLTAFPVTKLVAKAVSVLEALTEPVRDIENQSLLRFPNLGGGVAEYWSQGKITEFAEFLGIADNDGTPWQFSEHQFRRFFAMTFFYKYEGGDLATLSWHLRHTDFEMTAKYITDKDFRLAFDQVRAERVVSLAESAAQNGCKLSGNMQQELGDFFKSFDGVSASRAENMIKEVGKTGYVLNFVAAGACFGQTPDLKARSNCLLDDAVQLSSSSRESCAGCKNLLAFETGIRAEDVRMVVEPASSPMLNAIVARQAV